MPIPYVDVDDEALAETRALNAQIEALLAANPSVHTVPPEVTRRARAEGRSWMGPVVVDDEGDDRSIGGPGGEIPLRVFVPPTVDGIYLHLHGGGWTLGASPSRPPSVRWRSRPRSTSYAAASRAERSREMPAELNHIILPSNDMRAAASFTTHILGLEPHPQWGPFMPVVLANGVTIDYMDAEVRDSHHCAFIVGDDEFEPIFERIKAAGIPYYADPGLRREGEINHHDGGSGVYFHDPDGHLLEVITRPYGTGALEG